MSDSAEKPVEPQRAVRNTLTLVLAGGRGTRLMQLTDDEAKPAVPFGGKFRIVDFPLSNCIHSGLRKIGVLTQYKAHTLIHHLQRGWGFLRAELNEFVELWPAQQQTPTGSWYAGTADAVYQNLALIERHAPEYVLVLAGDHVYRQDYSKLIACHAESGADATVSCVDVPRAEARGFGVVAVDAGDLITGFLEKPEEPPVIPGRPDRAFASMGIYIFNARFLVEELKRDAADEASTHDFGKDLLPRWASRARIKAHRFADSAILNRGTGKPYWRDVGTVDAYWEANIDLTRVTPELDLYDRDWPIWTYQVQLPPAKFVFDDEGRRGSAVDSLVSAGCVVSGGTVRRSLLFNDVLVRSWSLVEDSILLPGATVSRRARLKRTVVGPGAVIPEGTVIGEDPSRDSNRFHVTSGGVTLVTPEMLRRLA
ncbi:MAG: glucose-1-phosphate adenylyltransferase [Proteobacteria bacterium]|nr:glucose-1-phosphate adenylyltransferase [Pseudomonadota bacterium]